MKTVRKAKTAERERVTQMVSRDFRKQIKVLAAIDGITVEAAFDRYAAPAVAKAFEAKTAPTK